MDTERLKVTYSNLEIVKLILVINQSKIYKFVKKKWKIQLKILFSEKRNVLTSDANFEGNDPLKFLFIIKKNNSHDLFNRNELVYFAKRRKKGLQLTTLTLYMEILDLRHLKTRRQSYKVCLKNLAIIFWWCFTLI